MYTYRILHFWIQKRFSFMHTEHMVQGCPDSWRDFPLCNATSNSRISMRHTPAKFYAISLELPEREKTHTNISLSVYKRCQIFIFSVECVCRLEPSLRILMEFLIAKQARNQFSIQCPLNKSQHSLHITFCFVARATPRNRQLFTKPVSKRKFTTTAL